MNDILSFVNHFKQTNSKLSIIVAEAAMEVEAELIDINVEQMNESILSTGKKITPKYSKNYAKMKGKSNPDLNDTGDFQSGIFIERRLDVLTYDSIDYKGDKLEQKYSENIYGTAPKNRQREADEIDPNLVLKLDKLYTNGIK